MYSHLNLKLFASESMFTHIHVYDFSAGRPVAKSFKPKLLAASSHEAGSARYRLHGNSSDRLREITDFRDESLCQWQGGYYRQSIAFHNNGTGQ